RGCYTRGRRRAGQRVPGAAQDGGLPALIIRPGVLVGADGPGIDALTAVVVGRQLVLLGDAAGVPPLISVHDAAELIVGAGAATALEPGTVLHGVADQTTATRTPATPL